MKENSIFVIFGGTGDLVKQKLVKSFSDLVERKIIKNNSTIIGVARGDLTNESYKSVLIENAENEKDKSNISKLDINFLKGDVSNPSSLVGLADFIKKLNKSNAKIVFYLAISFKLFHPIIKEIESQGLNKGSIIVFEKPFGENLSTAEKLEKDLFSIFTKEQIFHIDHYLGKEKVIELKSAQLKPEEIKSITVVADENIGVGERLGYYNHTGAISDMIQNHLLQVLSLLNKNKVDFLKSLLFDKSKSNILGQYSTYAEEVKAKGFEKNKIETFTRLHFVSSLPEWSHIDLTLQTGKKLNKKETKIVINFKDKKELIIDLSKNNRDEHSILIESAIHGHREMFASSEEILESWRIVEQIDKNKINFVIYEDGIASNNIR